MIYLNCYITFLYWLVLDGGLSLEDFSLTGFELGTFGLEPGSELNDELIPELDDDDDNDDVDVFGVTGLSPIVAVSNGVTGDVMKRLCVAFE